MVKETRTRVNGGECLIMKVTQAESFPSLRMLKDTGSILPSEVLPF